MFDTTFSADLTIMEEGTELLQRLQAGDLDNQPMFTSVSYTHLDVYKRQAHEVRIILLAGAVLIHDIQQVLCADVCNAQRAVGADNLGLDLSLIHI